PPILGKHGRDTAHQAARYPSPALHGVPLLAVRHRSCSSVMLMTAGQSSLGNPSLPPISSPCKIVLHMEALGFEHLLFAISQYPRPACATVATLCAVTS